MKHLSALIRKSLGSRKFWAAVTASGPFAVGALAAVDPFAMLEHWENFALVWMSYAGIQGTVDALEGHGIKSAKHAPDAPPPDAPAPGVPVEVSAETDISTVTDGIAPPPKTGGKD